MSTDRVLRRIDEAIEQLCGCGCGQLLSPDGPSGFFVDDRHQAAYQARQADQPGEVYGRPDADTVFAVERRRARGLPADLDDARMPILFGDAELGGRLMRLPLPELDWRSPHNPDGPPDGLRPMNTPAAPLRWRRWCHPCGEFVQPRVLRTPAPSTWTFVEETLNPSSLTEVPETWWCQGCPVCGATFRNGPPLQAGWAPALGGYAVAIALAAYRGGDRIVGTRAIDPVSYGQEGIDRMLQSLERDIYDLLIYCESCASVGCGKTGRSHYHLRSRVEIQLHDSQGIVCLPPHDGSLWLCPRHDFIAQRAVCPITGRPVVGLSAAEALRRSRAERLYGARVSPDLNNILRGCV
jgi:hypothetical protein